jgi:hypothetical protein
VKTATNPNKGGLTAVSIPHRCGQTKDHKKITTTPKNKQDNNKTNENKKRNCREKDGGKEMDR